MKMILTIGYQAFLLPTSANVNVLLSTLSKATALKHEQISGEYVYVSDTSYGREKVKIEMVDDNKVIDPKKVSRKAIPETASPDAHNTFGLRS